MTERRRTLLSASIVGAVVLAALAKVVLVGHPDAEPVEEHAPSVVVVVLGDVRADRTSVCGHSRPTTPTLERLVSEGAVSTCSAYAPGSWALPTHASLMTGLPPWEHGAHRAESTPAWSDVYFSRLGSGTPTLAEEMSERGYLTALVSANPLVSEHTGLARGFELKSTAAGFGDLYGDRIVFAVRGLLERQAEGDDRPLFLFAHIGDAHEPWLPIPPSTDWLPPRRGVSLHAAQEGEQTLWQHFTAGELTDEERAAVAEHIADSYDYGVWRADYALSALVEELRAQGRLGQGSRLVITSDHGEYLGEHGLIDHGRALWEENQRVPLLAVGFDELAELPEPLIATVAYHLARDGALPSPAPDPIAASWPDPLWSGRTEGAWGASTSVAMWRGAEKMVWTDGEVRRYDLASGEAGGGELVAEPWPELAEVVSRVRADLPEEEPADAGPSAPAEGEPAASPPGG